MHWRSSVHLPFYYFLAALTLLRLLTIPFFGLGVDEAHYVLYGKELSLSYFDHPPLVGWVQFVFTSLFGEGAFGARISAVLIGVAASLMLYGLIWRISGNAVTSMVAALALNTAFIFNALFMMLLPDTLLFLLLIPVIYATLQLERENTLLHWLILGVLLGLAGLAKYTAVLFIVPIALYFLLKRRFDLFITPKMLPGIVLALVVISPVLIWNFQNDWISFTYQSDHVVGSDTINWIGFGQSVAAQFAAYSPLLFPVAFFGLYKAYRSRNDLLLLSALFGTVLILFFTYASLYKPALPHWSAPFYLLFIPIGSYFLWESSKGARNYLKGAIALSGLVTVVLYAELIFKFVPFGDYQSIHRDIYGFDTIMKEANALIDDPAAQAVAVTNWTLASRTLYYNMPYTAEAYLIDKRYDQFDFWQKSSPLGKELLFITTKAFSADIGATMHCDTVELLKQFDITLNGKMVNRVKIVSCTNFKGLKK